MTSTSTVTACSVSIPLPIMWKSFAHFARKDRLCVFFAR